MTTRIAAFAAAAAVALVPAAAATATEAFTEQRAKLEIASPRAEAVAALREADDLFAGAMQRKRHADLLHADGDTAGAARWYAAAILLFDGKRYPALKRVLARELHRDFAPGDGIEKAVREAVFKKVWPQVEDIENKG